MTASEKSSSYPASCMAFNSMAPRPPASAMAAPDIPANTTDARILAWASPPVICPTSLPQKSKMRSVTSPLFIRFPARIKPGTANRVNVLAPSVRRCTSMIRAMSLDMKYRVPLHRRQNAMGHPNTISSKKLISNTAIFYSPSCFI